MNFNVVTLRGGNSKSMINHPPVNEVDLVVGTIGIVNKLSSLGIYKFKMVRMVVADEADTLFDESFAYLLRRFLKKIQVRVFGISKKFFKCYNYKEQFIRFISTV